MGTLPSEKVNNVYFSGAGNILCTVDKEFNRIHLNFYMISKITYEGQTTQAQKLGVDHKKEVYTKDARDQTKNLGAVDDTYEFQKIARHDVKDRNWIARWDQSGRYFMIHGRKTMSLDRSAKNVMFYNIHGELIDKIENVPHLEQVQFRNRATDVLKPNQIKQLKKDYKKKYGTIIDKEQAQEKKAQNDIIKDKRKKIRDDFLENFFMPLRQEYEENVDKYQALFPIKETDMNEEKVEQINIYQYMEEMKSR